LNPNNERSDLFLRSEWQIRSRFERREIQFPVKGFQMMTKGLNCRCDSREFLSVKSFKRKTKQGFKKTVTWMRLGVSVVWFKMGFWVNEKGFLWSKKGTVFVMIWEKDFLSTEETCFFNFLFFLATSYLSSSVCNN
jgi:hypothetical protein